MHVLQKKHWWIQHLYEGRAKGWWRKLWQTDKQLPNLPKFFAAKIFHHMVLHMIIFKSAF